MLTSSDSSGNEMVALLADTEPVGTDQGLTPKGPTGLLRALRAASAGDHDRGLPIVDAAFTEAGYLPIPSAPRQVAQRARNRDVTITWSPPATAAETVAGYQVVDGAGAVVCQSATTACTLTGLPDGTYTYAVRARNAEGEGDVAAGGPGSVIASPPQPAPPTVTRVSRSRYTVTITTIAGRTSAVVRSYLVRDQAGTAVCTLPVADQAAPSLSCSWSPRRGTYTLTVAADTEMGPSPTSAPSARISVR